MSKEKKYIGRLREALNYALEILEAPDHKMKASVKKKWDREVRNAGIRIIKSALAAGGQNERD